VTDDLSPEQKRLIERIVDDFGHDIFDQYRPEMLGPLHSPVLKLGDNFYLLHDDRLWLRRSRGGTNEIGERVGGETVWHAPEPQGETSGPTWTVSLIPRYGQAEAHRLGIFLGEDEALACAKLRRPDYSEDAWKITIDRQESPDS
jgi:hypothetical protein